MNPWLTIWTKPRLTVATMAATAPWQWVWLLVLVGGVSRVIERLALVPSLTELEPSALLAIVILSGALAGLMLVLVVARVMYWILRWMGGTGTWVETRTVAAWALAPGAPSAVLWGAMVSSYGVAALNPAALSGADDPRTLILGIDYGVQFGLTIWSLAIEIVCLAHVHNLAVWKVIAAEAGLGAAFALLALVGFYA